jgi:hypothetical protein
MSDNLMADAADSPMGQILSGQLSRSYKDLLCHFIYEARDIDGMTIWGKGGQPDWHAHMMKMAEEAKTALGPDHEEIYRAFENKREAQIYGNDDDQGEDHDLIMPQI